MGALLMRKCISLVGIKDENELRELSERFKDFCFELSYNLTEEKLRAYLPYIENRVSSLHALSPRREYFPNFGSKDKETIEWSIDRLREDAERALRLKADVIVLHPGYLSDSLIPSDSQKRLSYFENEMYTPYIAYKKGSICTREYIKSDIYRDAFERMLSIVSELSNELSSKGIKLSLENLNPRAGYLLIHPDEMIEAARCGNFLNLDIGHLWVTSELFSLDFLSEIKRIMETGKVRNVHLHTNASDRSKEIFEDTHNSLNRNRLPIQETLALLSQYDANLVIETLDGTYESALLLEAI